MPNGQNRSEQADFESEVLAFVAVAGDQAGCTLILHAFPDEERIPAFEALQGLLSNGLLEETDDGSLRFASDQARGDLASRLSAADRARQHLAVANAILARDGEADDEATIAAVSHFIGAVPLIEPSDAAARCLAAGEILYRRGEHKAAGDLLESGLDLIGRGRATVLQARLLTMLGKVQLATIEVWGSKPVARTLESAMLAHAETGNMDAALHVAGLPLPATHGRDTTVRFLESAAGLAEEHPEHAALIKTRLARAYLLERADSTSAVRTIDQAIRHAEVIGREDLNLRALAARAFIMFYANEPEAAERDVQIVLQASTSDPERLAELDACETAVNLCLLSGDLERMYEIGTRLVAAGEWTQNPQHTALGEMVRGRTKFSSGDLDLATVHLEESYRLQPRWLIPISLLAQLSYLRGDAERFEHWMGKLNALKLPEKEPGRVAIGFSPAAVWCRQLIDLGELTGNPELIDRARLIVESPALGTGAPFSQMAAMEPAAKLAIIDSDERTITAFDHEFRDLYGDNPPWIFISTVALTTFHAGDRERARTMLKKGVRFGQRNKIWLWTLDIAETLLGISGGNRAKPSNASIALANWAANLAEEHGILNGIDRIKETLKRHPRSQFGGSPESGLTPRQQEVIALMSQGMTNKQIGTELYTHPYTIDTHVRNIFLKLGANSRAEAVRKWTEANR